MGDVQICMIFDGERSTSVISSHGQLVVLGDE